jgi:hypothetical protein
MCLKWMHVYRLIFLIQIRLGHAMGIVLLRIHNLNHGLVDGGMLV